MRITGVLAAAAVALTSASPLAAHGNDDALAAFAALFEESAIVSGPELVDCRLSGGAVTVCYKITVVPGETVKAGPWCPRTITDGPEVSGIWFDDGKVYNADGAFVANLPEFYGDPTWQLHDPATGHVFVTDNQIACEAAARPDVDPAYRNHCVECLTSYIDPGLTRTYIVPIAPVEAGEPQRLGEAGGAGLAFDGIMLGPPAPVEAILGSHTLAPFDDCGGHVNPHVGYHYHAVTDCQIQIAAPNAHAPLIGIALDGVSIYGQLNADGSTPERLDVCRGHTSEALGYHYHVSGPGDNQIIGCHSHQIGCVSDDPDRPCDATQRRPPPPR
ncbi:YHYH protein [Bauldia sp.]|uniref:YHYH protein n=1 Tax=Bauldia sp. TaxID=2575872 RepID=UPI003BA8B113